MAGTKKSPPVGGLVKVPVTRGGGGAQPRGWLA